MAFDAMNIDETSLLVSDNVTPLPTPSAVNSCQCHRYIQCGCPASICIPTPAFRYKRLRRASFSALSIAPMSNFAVKYVEMSQALRAHGAFMNSEIAQYDEAQYEVHN